MTKNKGDYYMSKGAKKKYKVNNKRVEVVRYGKIDNLKKFQIWV